MSCHGISLNILWNILWNIMEYGIYYRISLIICNILWNILWNIVDYHWNKRGFSWIIIDTIVDYRGLSLIRSWIIVDYHWYDRGTSQIIIHTNVDHHGLSLILQWIFVDYHRYYRELSMGRSRRLQGQFVSNERPSLKVASDKLHAFAAWRSKWI